MEGILIPYWLISWFVGVLMGGGGVIAFGYYVTARKKEKETTRHTGGKGE
jgi:hypothetical protein